MRICSYGGGVQSTALLVLAAQRRIDFPVFLFANVGDDSEHPATLAYVRDVAMPYAVANGIAIHELHKVRRNGERETLMERLIRRQRSVIIPVSAGRDARPMPRTCTVDFKINVIRKWLKAHGATATDPAIVALGISVDELQRARTPTDPRNPEQYRVYPLLDLHLSRGDCQRIITDAGLPVPQKSSCYFCPFHRLTEWQRLEREEPTLFAKSEALETMLHERSVALGMHTPVWLTRSGQPLREAVGSQAVFDFDDTCESGYCETGGD